MKIGSLFSGIGGLELGLEWAGFGPTVWQVEQNEYCLKVLEKHWPNVKRFEDVQTVTHKELEKVDLICGGFPCQDISSAGKGAGLKGARSSLWYEFLRVVKELRPEWVVVENVASGAKRWVDFVRGDLEQQGYATFPIPLSAADCGAPHLRKRVFIVAYTQREPIRDEQGRRSGAHGERKTESGYDGAAGIVADAYEKRRWQRAGPGKEQTRRRQLENENWWQTEPDVGGSLDGFSAWLDGFDMTQSRILCLTYANAEKKRPCEILRTLRNGVSQGEEEERPIRRPVGVSAEEVLLAYLRKLEAYYADKTRVQLEGEETSRTQLPSLRSRKKFTSTPCRSKHKKQYCGEYPNSVQALSRLLAHHSEKAWIEYRRKNALAGVYWESGIARVADGIPHRAHRLKALGNAVVPQCAQVVGEFIKILRRI